MTEVAQRAALPASTRSVVQVYDGLAPDYHLLYGSRWDAAVTRQGAALARLIRGMLGDRPGSVLDCSCGIGTQAIGLALQGYRVHGTDISGRAIDRARAEAERLGANVTFGVADFRDLSQVAGTYDVVMSCDNALPHLLGDAEIETALRSMRSRLAPGGLLIVTIRDYDRLAAERPPVAAPQVVPGPPRRLLIRLHDWDAVDSPLYTVRLIVLTETPEGWTAAEHATRYRAITRAELAGAAERAGFADVNWPDTEVLMEQPVMTARGGYTDLVEVLVRSAE